MPFSRRNHNVFEEKSAFYWVGCWVGEGGEGPRRTAFSGREAFCDMIEKYAAGIRVKKENVYVLGLLHVVDWLSLCILF